MAASDGIKPAWVVGEGLGFVSKILGASPRGTTARPQTDGFPLRLPTPRSRRLWTTVVDDPDAGRAAQQRRAKAVANQKHGAQREQRYRETFEKLEHRPKSRYLKTENRNRPNRNWK